MKCIICGSKSKIFLQDLFDDRYGSPGLFSIYRCCSCGFGRTNPVLSKSKIGEFYKKYYPLSVTSAIEVKKSVNVVQFFIAWLLGINNTSHRHIKSGKKVLDIGSGTGTSLLEIKKMGSIGFGVEPDPSAQKIARKLKLSVFKGFLSDNPFPKDKFDFITASQVIEHEPEPKKFLTIARNKIDVDGQIVLSFPNIDSAYRKIFGRFWLNWHVPYHINFFNKNSILASISSTGLKIDKIQTITPNVWTLMQFRSMFSVVSEGKKNPIWTKSTSKGFVLGESINYKKYLQVLLVIIFMVVITPINRAIDLLGLGDSILIKLKKV